MDRRHSGESGARESFWKWVRFCSYATFEVTLLVDDAVVLAMGLVKLDADPLARGKQGGAAVADSSALSLDFHAHPGADHRVAHDGRRGCSGGSGCARVEKKK